MFGFCRQCIILDGILPMTESLVLVLRGAAVLYHTSKEATMESEHVLRQFTELDAELQASLYEGGPQISVRSSHLFLTVNSSVLVLREECNQVDILGDDIQVCFWHSAS